MFDHKVVLLDILLFGVCSQSLYAMDTARSLALRNVTTNSQSASLETIVRSSTSEPIERTLDRYLWVLKKEDYKDKELDKKRSRDYVNEYKFSATGNRLALHMLYFYFFDPEGEIVWRSGAFRQTYSQRTANKNAGHVFCACLEKKEERMPTTEITDILGLIQACVADTSLPTVALRCSDLEQHAGCTLWRHLMKLNQVNSLIAMEEVPRELLEELDRRFQGLMDNWETTRLLVALLQESDAELFQFGLLYNDYDFIAHCLQHKLKIPATTFFAASVPMLELLDQYGVVDLIDEEGNTPFHHFAEHGRLIGANVLDFYDKKRVDPLAKNKNEYTPLDLLVHASFRFDSGESKLRKFVTLLLNKGARGSDISVKAGERSYLGRNWLVPQKTVLDVAQETHQKWRLPATALVLNALKEQELKDARYAQYRRFKEALAITYPRVPGDTPLHYVVKRILQKHDRLVHFDHMFNDLGYEERLAYFKQEFETIDTLFRVGYDFAAQNSNGKTILHELCAGWHSKEKQRDILYRKLLSLILKAQTAIDSYPKDPSYTFLCEQQAIQAVAQKLMETSQCKDFNGSSVLDLVCTEPKPCTHEDCWSLNALVLGETVTFKKHLITFLQYYLTPRQEDEYKIVFGLYESCKKHDTSN